MGQARHYTQDRLAFRGWGRCRFRVLIAEEFC